MTNLLFRSFKQFAFVLVLMCTLMSATSFTDGIVSQANAQTAKTPKKTVKQPAKTAKKTAKQPAQTHSPVTLANLRRIQSIMQDNAVFQILLAEMAIQNNYLDEAADLYTRLAFSARDTQVYSRAIEVAIYVQRLDLAAKIADDWVKAFPDLMLARQTIIAVNLTFGQVDATEPHLARIFADNPDKLDENFKQLSRIFALQTDREAVLNVVNNLAKPYPKLPEAHLAIAYAAKNANQDELAFNKADEALRLSPSSEAAVLAKASLLKSKSSEEALTTLKRFVAEYPGARDVKLYLASTLFTAKHYDEARQYYQNLLSEYPDDPDVVFPFAVLALEQNDTETAEKELRHLLKLDFRDKNTIRYYLGMIAESLDKMDDAKFFFDNVDNGKHYIDAKRKYALILLKEKQIDDARNYLQNCKAHNSNERAKLILSEAMILREAKQLGEALALVENAITADPSQPDLLYDGSMLAENMKRYDLTDIWLKRLIESDPTHAHALNALAYSYVERGINLDEATQLLDAALEIAPDDPFILDSKGWLLFTQGKLDDALVELQRAYQIRPDPEIAAHIGEVQWQLGQHEEAKKTWEEAAKLDSDHESLNAVRAKYLP